MDLKDSLGMGAFAHGTTDWVMGLRDSLGMGVFAHGTAYWIMDMRDSLGVGVFVHGMADWVLILFTGCTVFVGVTVTGDELTGVEVE